MELPDRDKKARGHGSCLRKAQYCPQGVRCYSLPDLDLNSRAVEPPRSGRGGKVFGWTTRPRQTADSTPEGASAAPAGVVERPMASAAILVATAGMSRPMGDPTRPMRRSISA